MNEINRSILAINKVICSNIEKFGDSERGLLAQNILSQLRNLIEHISLKVLNDQYNDRELEVSYPNLTEGIEYVKSRGDLKFLSRFHGLLQITTSHYTLDEEGSERLMLKYFEYLIKIKKFLENEYNLEVLQNLDQFPIHSDPNLKEYYEKISEKLNQPEFSRLKSSYNDRYYIQKIKPFFVDFEIYYEVTFTRAHDYVSKFDRIIAFTKLNITKNYAVRLSVSNDNINVLGKKMPIQIIDEWEVSIRPCELNNFAKIFAYRPKTISGTNEAIELMKHLTNTGMSLIELIDLNDHYYNYFRNNITEKARVSHIFKILDICRKLSKNNSNGSNVIRYLLHRLNNKIIKKQYHYESCELLSKLKLSYGCLPFDQMPFNSSLINHNPKLSDIFECINANNRDHEIFARIIKNNTEYKGILYTPVKDLFSFTNIDDLIEKWNKSIYYKHEHRKIKIFKNHIYIKGYEEDTAQIIKKLKEISSNGIRNYRNSVEDWLNSLAYRIDSEEKKDALKKMFESSKVALIYGAAGTGKTTMINHLSNFFNEEDKLYLANTNPAVDNLKRRVKAGNCSFKTITKFLYNTNDQYDLIIIDECSTVSNSDMLKILNNASFELLVLVGDIYQIESILFGNWFSLIKSFVPKTSVFELFKPYRSNKQKLLDLWDRVRNIDDSIHEHIQKNSYSVNLDESIFENTQSDEIILCLNYDGLYGINNINAFLQSNNPKEAFFWGTHSYKVNDPIIFNESGRFAPLIYNNLKGKITQIEKLKNKIQFDTEINMVINELDAIGYDFELLDNSDQGKSVIRFIVNKPNSTDEDDDSTSKNIVPFQVAYAVSIHKAQGLEYNSVKIVITDEVEEMISHNIFYTAITRAREELKIYWTPQTENKILKGLEKKSNGKDLALLKVKYRL